MLIFLIGFNKLIVDLGFNSFIDNSVYDGGMPILYYNIYLDNNKDSQNAISSVAQSNKIEITNLNLGLNIN